MDGTADPPTELEARIDQCLYGPGFEEFGHWERMKVYHELFAYARHDERHRETLNEHYAEIRSSIVEVVREGISEGVFREVDPELMGQFITDAIHVARSRKISLGHDNAPDQTRDAIHQFIFPVLNGQLDA